MRIYFTLIFTLACFLFSLPRAKADFPGAEISYKCTSTPGIFEVTLIMYRECTEGVQMCSGPCGSACTHSVNIMGADPSCASSTFGSVSLSLQSVRDVNSNPHCPSAKSACTNMGCQTAGTYTPAMERYEFVGFANVGPTSGVPANCCNVRLAFSICCRAADINTGSGGQNYYTDAVINRCASVSPCNSSPVFGKDPLVVACSGPVIFNNAAMDPDHDSLTYSFAPALQDFNSAVTYDPPWAYNKPMPWSGAWDGTFPTGIRCDPTTGDFLFTPQNVSGNDFKGVVAFEIKQWKNIDGVPTLMGITRRDVEMIVLHNCPPNNSPRFITDPPSTANPFTAKTQWEVCAGEQLCFTVTAKDTDYIPTVISDTTYLTCDGALTGKGATFTPTYTPATRTSTGPREDSYQFCWTPADNMASSIPYYFTISAQDDRCANSGTIARAFSVKVLGKTNLSVNKTKQNCGKWQIGYVNNTPEVSPISSTWTISSQPGDYSLTQSPYVYSNMQTLPVIHFTKGGKYLIKLESNSTGPAGTAGCATTPVYDTLVVDSQVTVEVRDTFTCYNDSVTFSASAHHGTPSYIYKWYNSINDTGGVALNAPFYINPALKVYTETSRYYTIVVKDIAGCISIDSLHVMSNPSFSAIKVTNVSCNGQNSGSIIALQTDSTATYQYQLNGGAPQSSGTFNNLAPGAYTLFVQDNGGCSRSFTNLDITEPAALTDSATTSTNETCFNSNTGSITTFASGGTAPYLYRLDSTAYDSVNIFNDLKPRAYTVYIKDNNGCGHSFSRTIVKALDSISYIVTKNDPTCFNVANGSISLTVTGGKTPYQYNLDGGSFGTANTFSNVAAGSHEVQIKDSNNCIKTIAENLTQPPVLSYTTVITDVDCFGNNNGSVKINATGGTPPYTYRTGSTSFDSSSLKTGLAPATHFFVIKDNAGCTTVLNRTITEPLQLHATAFKIPATCHDRNDGKITLVTSGGSAPYEYKLNSGAFGTGNTFTNLPNGQLLSFTIKDSHGCTKTHVDSMENPAPIQAGPVTGPMNPDKGPVHTYSVPALPGMSYLWSADKGTIVGSATADIVNITWDTLGSGYITIVVYSDSTCADTVTSAVNIVHTGMAEAGKQMGLEIYPNPAKTVLNITLQKLPADTRITLYDMQGKVMLEQPLKLLQQVNIEHLPQGIYMLKVGDWRGSVIKE
jgi:hypothetical protein